MANVRGLHPVTGREKNFVGSCFLFLLLVLFWGHSWSFLTCTFVNLHHWLSAEKYCKSLSLLKFIKGANRIIIKLNNDTEYNKYSHLMWDVGARMKIIFGFGLHHLQFWDFHLLDDIGYGMFVYSNFRFSWKRRPLGLNCQKK